MRICLLFFFSSFLLTAQVKKLDTVFCDCGQARVVNIQGKTIVGKTIAPIGEGYTSEISASKQRSKFTFEKEHNSAWYQLKIGTSGALTFDIIPSKFDDDYDFMLFKANPNNFCDSLLKHKIQPLRSCISRDKEELLGKTGINYTSDKENVKQGIGASYCKSIEVKKGEIYYLVLDNVYEKGEGHTIQFNITSKVNFNGVVLDENKKGVIADISITNPKGDTVLTSKTKADGSYQFSSHLSANQTYSINFYNDSSFTYTKTFKVKDTAQFRNLQTIIPKLKKGVKYPVGAINFHGGSTNHLSQSLPAMRNLAKLMKKNKGLKIVIIGHSNGRDGMTTPKIIQFTKDRATAIKNFIIAEGIDASRIEIDGKGDAEMLFQIPGATMEQQEQNRRVEIMVIEY